MDTKDSGDTSTAFSALISGMVDSYVLDSDEGCYSLLAYSATATDMLSSVTAPSGQYSMYDSKHVRGS